MMLTEFLPLYTNRLRLRPFSQLDGDALFSLHRDPEVTKFAGGQKTLEESRASLQRLVSKGGDTGFCALAVEERSTGRVIGWCGLQTMSDSNRVEVIYALRRDRWGLGLALEAATALIRLGFGLNNPSLDEIFGLVYAENHRSIRVLEKLGMKFLEETMDAPTGRAVQLYRVSRDRFLELWD